MTETKNRRLLSPGKTDNSTDSNNDIIILLILLGLNLIYTIAKIFTSKLFIFDDIEHLRAAYFITLGDMPYRDFFEHHHPLLWYILAPMITIIPHNTVLAVYIGRIICFGVSLLTGYYIYKIEKKFIGGKICALICLNLYFWVASDITVRGLFQIRPDIWQHCCFFCGLYYLFCYFRYKKFKHLQIAAIMLTLAFLFLQTTVFQGALIVLVIGYFLYRHPQKIKDMLKAAIIPLFILCIGIYALWQADCLEKYYELNWQLNTIFAKLWSQIYNYCFFDFLLVLGMALAAICWYIKNKKHNRYWWILVFLCIGEGIRCFSICRYGQHYLMLIIYAAMVAAPLIYKKEILFIASIYITLSFTLIGLSSLSKPLNKSKIMKLLDQEKYGITIVSGIFSERPSYYWSHIPTEAVHDIYFHPIPNYDVNLLNKQYPMNFVYYFPDWSSREYQTLNDAFDADQQEIFKKHFISMDTLKDYQKIGKFSYLKSTP